MTAINPANPIGSLVDQPSGLPAHPPKATAQRAVETSRDNALNMIRANEPCARTPVSNTKAKGTKKATSERPKAESEVLTVEAWPTAAAAKEARATGGVTIDSTQ